MIYLEDRHKKIILEILKKYPYNFYIYGSRVKGTHRAASDVDICFMEPIPLSVQSHIEEEFEESDLPFRVDLTDFKLMAPDFQKRIQKEMYLLQSSKIIEGS